MSELLFRITGSSRRRYRRLRGRPRAANPGAVVMVWLIAGVAIVYGLGAILSRSVAILSGGRAAIVEGRILLGENVAVIPDSSGSMTTPERRERLADQIAQLKRAGMAVFEDRGVSGFGVSGAKPQGGLLFQVEQVLLSHPQVDTVYAFSDFDITSASYWQSDAEGYEQLAKLLQERRVRLYIGTVENPPPPDLAQIAVQSGGGLIE